MKLQVSIVGLSLALAVSLAQVTPPPGMKGPPPAGMKYFRDTIEPSIRNCTKTLGKERDFLMKTNQTRTNAQMCAAACVMTGTYQLNADGTVNTTTLNNMVNTMTNNNATALAAVTSSVTSCLASSASATIAAPGVASSCQTGSNGQICLMNALSQNGVMPPPGRYRPQEARRPPPPRGGGRR